MSEVAILFLRPGLGGGTTTYTAHLHAALAAAGHQPMIYRARVHTEDKLRPFGKYAHTWYRNFSARDLLQLVQHTPAIITAAAAAKDQPQYTLVPQLLAAGARLVVHDAMEFKVHDHIKPDTKLPTRPILIRQSMLRYFPTALWLPHPYKRSAPAGILRDKVAVSVTHVKSVKRTHLILEANRLLPPERRVEILGAEHRIYSYQLAQKYPDVFKQGQHKPFPMTFDAAPALCARAAYCVDMTRFPEDGGGTQYPLLEAMDAGTVNIMHEDWFAVPGSLRRNHDVLTVANPAQLASRLRYADYYAPQEQRTVEAGYEVLKQHDHQLVGNLYAEEMQL